MKAGTPKGIKIEDRSEGETVDLRLYKIWSKHKISPQPFIVTDSIPELSETFAEYAKRWKIKPSAENMKILYNLADKHNKKANNYNGQSNLF